MLALRAETIKKTSINRVHKKTSNNILHKNTSLDSVHKKTSTDRVHKKTSTDRVHKKTGTGIVHRGQLLIAYTRRQLLIIMGHSRNTYTYNKLNTYFFLSIKIQKIVCHAKIYLLFSVLRAEVILLVSFLN